MKGNDRINIRNRYLSYMTMKTYNMLRRHGEKTVWTEKVPRSPRKFTMEVKCCLWNHYISS